MTIGPLSTPKCRYAQISIKAGEAGRFRESGDDVGVTSRAAPFELESRKNDLHRVG